MLKFVDLIRPGAQVALPNIVAGTKLSLWKPSGLVPIRGRCVLIAFATWSTYDLRILDSLSEILQSSDATDDRVSIVDLDTLTPEQIGQCFSFPDKPQQEPFVSVWEDGRQIEANWGWRAKELLTRCYPGLQTTFTSYLPEG